MLLARRSAFAEREVCLWNLYTSTTSPAAVHFRKRCRTYNNTTAFSSLGITYDHTLAQSKKGSTEKHTGSIIIMAATIHYNIICYFLTEKVDGTGHQVCRYTRCTRQQAISLNKEPCGESILAQELQSVSILDV
ncbi:hypothetical protein OROMI_008390 [Orobanche minor]